MRSTPHSCSFQHERFEMLGTAAGNRHVAARDRAGEQQRAGHDAIGNDLVFDAVQFLDAFDRRACRVPRPAIFAPIAFRKFAEVDDFGFHRDVLDDVVVPSASTAASIAFLVAPTLGMRNSIVAPCKRLRLLSAMR